MVLKANDRRTSCPCHDEFRGPRSDYVRQVASGNNNMRVYLNIINSRRNGSTGLMTLCSNQLKVVRGVLNACHGIRQYMYADVLLTTLVLLECIVFSRFNDIRQNLCTVNGCSWLFTGIS
ncbi:hypothetical protein TNCV_2308121 [Trichonephila clavipes]|nr:hypothetical protein TNCV_2308121 [Trichonephila clavipes]